MSRPRPGRRTLALALTLALAGGLVAPGARAAGDGEADATVAHTPGTLPLVLAVPHDGTDFLGLTPVRQHGATVRDLGTRELAERVADRLQARLAQRPCLVVARISRKYLDVNRPEAEAMESPDALPAYRAYHARVAACVAEVRQRHGGRGLLVDVHGQSQAPDTTFRGTRAGLTTRALLSRFGPAALQGEHSLTGLLAARGYTVDPVPGTEGLREDPRYAGGHTVATYGSHRPDGIDAIQLEFGRLQRERPALADDLAEALIGFMTRHDLLPR